MLLRATFRGAAWPLEALAAAASGCALAVMHGVLVTLGMMSGARQRAVRDLMAPLLPGWIDAFARVVDPARPPGFRDAARCGLSSRRCVA